MNNRIRFGAPIEAEIPKVNLPPNALLVQGAGKWRSQPFQVYVVASVYEKIWQDVNQTAKIETKYEVQSY